MTTIDLLREENKTLTREIERLQGQLDSKHQKHPAPFAMRLAAWLTIAMAIATIILIFVRAITG